MVLGTVPYGVPGGACDPLVHPAPLVPAEAAGHHRDGGDVRPHVPDGRLARLLNTEAGALSHGHRLAFGREQPDVAVQTDAVHPDRGPVA